MGVNVDCRFKLYYVFKHKSGENIQYWEKHGCWSDNMKHAFMFHGECVAESAFKYALDNSETVLSEGKRVVIGRLDVDIDRFYDMKVIV